MQLEIDPEHIVLALMNYHKKSDLKAVDFLPILTSVSSFRSLTVTLRAANISIEFQFCLKVQNTYIVGPRPPTPPEGKWF